MAALRGDHGAGYARSGPFELRTGLDLSRARGNVVPLLNVYFGYVLPEADSYLDDNDDIVESYVGGAPDAAFRCR